MQLAYHEHGMQCEFTLMTIGDFRSASATPAPATSRDTSARPAERVTPTQKSPSQEHGHRQASNAMPPPSQPASRSFLREPASQRPRRPSPPPPKASLDHESLFLPQEDEDERQWDERDYDNEDQLGYDVKADGNVRTFAISVVLNWLTTTFQDAMAKGPSGGHGDRGTQSRLAPYRRVYEENARRVPPTQRISEVFHYGLWRAASIMSLTLVRYMAYSMI